MYGVESGTGSGDPARLARRGPTTRSGSPPRSSASRCACPASSSGPCSPPATRPRTSSTPCPPSCGRWPSPPPTSPSAASARSAGRCCGARRCRPAPRRPAIPGCSCAPPPPRPTTPTRTACSRRPWRSSTGPAATPSTGCDGYTDEVVKRARHNGQHAGRLLEHQTLAQVPVVRPNGRALRRTRAGSRRHTYRPALALLRRAGEPMQADAPQRLRRRADPARSTTCWPPRCSTSRTSPAPARCSAATTAAWRPGPLTLPPPRPARRPGPPRRDHHRQRAPRRPRPAPRRPRPGPGAACEARAGASPRRARRRARPTSKKPCRSASAERGSTGRAAQVVVLGGIVVERAVLAGEGGVVVVVLVGIRVAVVGPGGLVEEEVRSRLLELARFFEAAMAALLHGTAPELAGVDVESSP